MIVIVQPGRVVHWGPHAFGASDRLDLPDEHAAALIASGEVRREGEEAHAQD